jgi:hypothetical protein
MRRLREAALLLDSAEMSALLGLLAPEGVETNAEGAVLGASSLMERGLVTVQGETAQLSDGLAAVIAPIMNCRASLAVVRLGEMREEAYYFSGEQAVRRTTAGDESHEFLPMPAKDAPAAIAASLSQESAAALREPAIAEIGELSRLASVLGEEELPKPRSAVGLVLTQADGEERIVTVLLHDGGFTWVEAGKGERARVAYVETEEELAELIADLIGGGRSSSHLRPS